MSEHPIQGSDGLITASELWFKEQTVHAVYSEETIQLKRIADALERIADALAPKAK